MDLEKGKITGIVLSGGVKVLGLFGKTMDNLIDWNSIIKIGTDTILIDYKNDII